MPLWVLLKAPQWVPNKQVPKCLASNSADCKRGRRKGATSKNVRKRQKVSKSFSTLFDNLRAGQKIVKKCQKVSRHFSAIFAWHPFSSPSWGALINIDKELAIFQNHPVRYPFGFCCSLRLPLENRTPPAKIGQHTPKMQDITVAIRYLWRFLRGNFSEIPPVLLGIP